ncbi:MAG TPA: ABC transporter substrate-binding protein, partial [Microlunatus sp.]|nr:ABC transporter substrate-binding protein [Microlunatus sp.]
METSQITRRSFLHATAAAAGAVLITACSGGGDTPSGNDPGGDASQARGSATEPLPLPGSYQQAPSLDGADLPPVEERLPEHPYVIPHHWAQPGKYGGTLEMITLSSTGLTTADSDREFCYGHSILRFLNDGRDVGPGLAESWESNDDASEWTFHFRKGLKWSDGEPWTTADIMWWWEKFVLAQKMAQVVPDEARSGNGTPAKLEAVDDHTLRMTFDTPAPLTADRLAAYANGGIGKNGTVWMMPSH